ncbi:MAG: hypothetical protein KGQ32_10425, partial [Xanthomonadaceae bacterium]|nr:hypothetical protein [Xanthomonadaceae bacterium]
RGEGDAGRGGEQAGGDSKVLGHGVPGEVMRRIDGRRACMARVARWFEPNIVDDAASFAQPGPLILLVVPEYSRHPWRSRYTPPAAFAFAILQTQSRSDIRDPVSLHF